MHTGTTNIYRRTCCRSDVAAIQCNLSVRNVTKHVAVILNSRHPRGQVCTPFVRVTETGRRTVYTTK